MEKEKDVKKAVKKLLEKYQWFWWMPPANGFGKSGIADFNAVKNGVFLAIETKFGSNTLTPLQLAYLRAVHGEHCIAFVVNEKRLQSLEAWLESFDKSVQAAVAQKEASSEDNEKMLMAVVELTNELV